MALLQNNKTGVNIFHDTENLFWYNEKLLQSQLSLYNKYTKFEQKISIGPIDMRCEIKLKNKRFE